MSRRKPASPMPWREVVTPRTMKVLGALVGSMTLAAALLWVVEPSMQSYQPNARAVEPPQLRLSAQAKWDCIYLAAVPSPDLNVPCHFWVPREGDWQHGSQSLDVPIRSGNLHVLRIGVEPAMHGGGLTTSQEQQIDRLREFASVLGISKDAIRPDPSFHPGHRVITQLAARSN